MSQVLIRTALETAINGMAPSLFTAWENVTAKPPVPTTPYQQVFIKFGMPENIEQGLGYNEIGYMQVKLLYPINEGDAPARARALMLRTLFKKKASFSSGGVTTTIIKTPEIPGGTTDGDRWAIDVIIPFMAQIYS